MFDGTSTSVPSAMPKLQHLLSVLYTSNNIISSPINHELEKRKSNPSIGVSQSNN